MMSMIEAFGTSMPTSITVVLTRMSTSPALNRCIVVGRRHSAVQHRDAAIGKPRPDRFESLLQRLEIQLLRLLNDREDDVHLSAVCDLVFDEAINAFELRARPHR